jgi:hypothetical protein
MADPLFMAYGKGFLFDCPGDPEGLIDLVPVDEVVNAILACGALRPRSPEVFHLASSEQSPIKLKELYELLREYFLENPLVDSLTNKPIEVPKWAFKGSIALERRLWLGRLALGAIRRLISSLPLKGAAFKALKRRISRARRSLERALYYNLLYGPYLNNLSSSRGFSSVRSKLLFECLSKEDQELFPFALEGLNWRSWLHQTHLPILTGHTLPIPAQEEAQDEHRPMPSQPQQRRATHASSS